ncbi:hypothetical protein E2C01_056951 [Portunus trituberculatus]|uniref:Uncharacterized protein n=1 Tax=Portunus trituberculatus TaxID=210409 RepID=A0A5B7GRQ9_PORTR|nr:hypothetical protein [Portunus trituberculatus]
MEEREQRNEKRGTRTEESERVNASDTSCCLSTLASLRVSRCCRSHSSTTRVASRPPTAAATTTRPPDAPGLVYTASDGTKGAANRFLRTIYLMAIFSRTIRQPSSSAAINTCCAPPAHISRLQAGRENSNAESPSS